MKSQAGEIPEELKGSHNFFPFQWRCWLPMKLNTVCIKWEVQSCVQPRIQNAVSVAIAVPVAIRKNRLNAKIALHIAAKTQFGLLKNLSNAAVSSRIGHILNPCVQLKIYHFCLCPCIFISFFFGFPCGGGGVYQVSFIKKQLRCLPVQTVSISLEHHFSCWRFKLLIYHQNTYSTLINTSPTSTTAHLYVFSTGYPSELISIKLSDICKNDCLCRHVQPYAKGLCRKQTLKNLIQNWCQVID